MKKQGKYLTAFQRKSLEKNLNTKGLRPEYQRRIKIMLLADEGLTKAKISKSLKCTTETARYWIGQAKAGQAHNWQDCPLGRPKTINAEYLTRLKELVKSSPRDYGYSFERWTGQWLSKHLNQELGIEISSIHVNRLLKQMGLSTRANRAKSIIDNPLNTSSTASGIALRELSSASKCKSHQERTSPQHADKSFVWQLNFLG